MIRNNDLTDCNGMFYELSNITNFDFSKFNGKNLIDLRCMFYGAKSCVDALIIHILHINYLAVMVGCHFIQIGYVLNCSIVI
jgi:hypothetical protein